MKSNVTVASPHETNGVNTALIVSPPTIIADQSQDEHYPLRYTLSFKVSQALQSLAAEDDDLTQIVTLIDGTGHVLSRELSASRDAIGVVRLDPDQSVQDRIRLAFDKFRELGSAQKVLRYMAKNGLKLPRRQTSGLCAGTGLWEKRNAARLD